MLPKNESESKFNGYLADFVKKHKPAEYMKDGFLLQPLKEMHFDDRFTNFSKRTFGHDLISAFTFIGIFLLVIACVNFINLSTSQAVTRAKEVGVRKVLGSNRHDLIIQFMGEAGMITFFAIMVAYGIAVISIQPLSSLLGISLANDMLLHSGTILFTLFIFVAVTFLSGFYPALVLSGFNPIRALKNKINTEAAGGISLRRLLVVLQFSIAQGLIIGTLVVVSQMDYFRNASLGFNKEAVISVPLPVDSINRTKMEYLRNQLLQQPGIKNVSFSFGTPSDNSNWDSDLKFDNSSKNTDFSVNLKWADTSYFRMYDMKLVAGRIYQPGDTVKEFVVNETFLKKAGIKNPEDAIGKKLNFWDGRIVANIVGVVKDFHSLSLRDSVVPVVMGTLNNVYTKANIRLDPVRAKTALAYVDRLWKTSFPDEIFSYEFLDEKIEAFYFQENQLAQLYKIFAGIAIFISCLGLYGLISFMTVRRTKELGIRKILGASVSHILYLLSKEFTLLILIAFLISTPVAWYIMQQWLEKFAFRIHFGPAIFITTVIASVVIAWITVAWRAVNAALASPVKNLRTE
jgi:putative ABC transport system permease protein